MAAPRPKSIQLENLKGESHLDTRDGKALHRSRQGALSHARLPGDMMKALHGPWELELNQIRPMPTRIL